MADKMKCRFIDKKNLCSCVRFYVVVIPISALCPWLRDIIVILQWSDEITYLLESQVCGMCVFLKHKSHLVQAFAFNKSQTCFWYNML